MSQPKRITKEEGGGGKEELFQALTISWWKHENTASAVLSGGDLYQSTQASNESRAKDVHRLGRLQSVLLSGGGLTRKKTITILVSACAT